MHLRFHLEASCYLELLHLHELATKQWSMVSDASEELVEALDKWSASLALDELNETIDMVHILR